MTIPALILFGLRVIFAYFIIRLIIGFFVPRASKPAKTRQGPARRFDAKGHAVRDAEFEDLA